MTKPSTGHTPPARWIDLGISWFDQYDAKKDEPEWPARLNEILGYLDATSVAFLTYEIGSGETAGQATQIQRIAEWLTRAEAEFCGRILADGSDLGRWLDEPSGLTWAVLGLKAPILGFTLADFARLTQRGLRIIALDPTGDQDGQFQFLESHLRAGNARLAVDLSSIPGNQVDQTLDRIGAMPQLSILSLPLLRSLSVDQFQAIPDSTLTRIAKARGLVGLTLKGAEPERVRAAIERAEALRERDGLAEFVGLCSGFLSEPRAVAQFSSAEKVRKTFSDWFEPPVVTGLLQTAATQFLTQLVGPAILPVRDVSTQTSRVQERPEY